MSGRSHLEHIESTIRAAGDVFGSKSRVPSARPTGAQVHSSIRNSSGYSDWVDWVNDNINPTAAVDVYCGYNDYRHVVDSVGNESGIRNLTGFDMFQSSDDTVDIHKSFTEVVDDNEFAENSLDLVLCHGTFGFGNYESVKYQLEQIKRWCKNGAKISLREWDNSEMDGGPTAWEFEEDLSFAFTPAVITQLENDLGFTKHFDVETTSVLFKRNANGDDPTNTVEDVKARIHSNRSSQALLDKIDKVNNEDSDAPQKHLHVWWWTVNK